MQVLSQWLYTVSTLLLIPVMVVLLVMLAWAVVLFGGFLREWSERARVRKALAEALKAPGRTEIWKSMRENRKGLAARLMASLPDSEAPPEEGLLLDHALAGVENALARSVATLSYLTRLGPMLGLMGTLIPLGPALTGLAGGNMQELSSNLVIAFTTTITGLFVSVLSYTMSLARRVWYEQDLADLELLVGRLKKGDAPHA